MAQSHSACCQQLATQGKNAKRTPPAQLCYPRSQRRASKYVRLFTKRSGLWFLSIPSAQQLRTITSFYTKDYEPNVKTETYRKEFLQLISSHKTLTKNT